MNEYDKHMFIHPLDEQLADKILHSVPVKKFMNLIFENRLDEMNQYIYSASCVCVENNHPCFKYFQEGCALFGVEQTPRVYLCRSYQYDIQCFGYNDPVIVIPEVLIREAEDNLLRGRMMAAAASVKAGHHKLTFLLWMIENFSGMIEIPFAATALRSLLYEWGRAQQYSLDRAFLIASGNYESALKNILFGEVPKDILKNFSFCGTDTFDSQVEEFYRKANPLDIASAIYGLSQCETWLPARYRELKKFYADYGGDASGY